MQRTSPAGQLLPSCSEFMMNLTISFTENMQTVGTLPNSFRDKNNVKESRISFSQKTPLNQGVA